MDEYGRTIRERALRSIDELVHHRAQPDRQHAVQPVLQDLVAARDEHLRQVRLRLRIGAGDLPLRNHRIVALGDGEPAGRGVCVSPGPDGRGGAPSRE